MLLFQRMMRLTGGPAATAWAVDVTNVVNKHATSEVSLWIGSYGAPVGTIGWSTMLDKLSQVDEYNAKMAADGEAVAMVGQGSNYVADVDADRLLAIIHGEVTESAPVGSYMEVTRAIAVPGKWMAAGEWAVHIAGVYSEITDQPVVVATTMAGPMGEYTWYSRHADGDSIEAGMTATMTSEKYINELEHGAEFFMPGVTQMYAQRLV